MLICEFYFTAVKCPDLPSPKYGSIHLSGTTLDHVAIYRCDKGFQLVGNTVRRCLTTGQWSGQAPVCERNAYLSQSMFAIQ